MSTFFENTIKRTTVPFRYDVVGNISIDRLCLSPQCGFASTEEGNILTEQQQWEKLIFIREIAEEIWE